MKISTIKILIIYSFFLFNLGYCQNYNSQSGKAISYWDDVRRSTVGMIGGTLAGGLIGDLMGKAISSENNNPGSFDNRAGAGIFIGMGIGSAIGSSLALHLSGNRDDNYLKLAGLSLLLTLIVVIPTSVHTINTEEDSDYYLTVAATSVSIISTTFLSPYLYHRFPLKQSSSISINFLLPSFKAVLINNLLQPTRSFLSLKLAEINF